MQQDVFVLAWRTEGETDWGKRTVVELFRIWNFVFTSRLQGICLRRRKRIEMLLRNKIFDEIFKRTLTHKKKLFLWHRFDYVYSILDSPFSLLKLENCAIEKHSNNRSPNSNNRSPISNICLRFQITVPWFQTTVPRFQVSGDRAFFEYWPKKGETRILKHVGRRFMSRNRIKQKID